MANPFVNLTMARYTLTSAIVVLGCVAGGQPVQAGALWHWSFDRSDNLGSDSFGANNLRVATGSPMHNAIDTKFGSGSLQLIGTSSMRGGGRDLEGSFTVAMWIKPADVSANLAGIVGKDNISTDRVFWIGQDDVDGAVRFGNYFDSEHETALITSGGAITNDRWQHLAAVWDQIAGRQTIYVDGNVTASAARPGSRQTVGDSTLFVGAGGPEHGAFSSGGAFFNGLVDELWLFDEPLGESEIRSLMNNNAVPEPSSLVLACLAAAHCMIRKR